MTDKRRGIVDPWRVVDPVRAPDRPPARPAREKINIEDVDRDADLAVPGRHTIRTTHAGFAITSVRIETPRDALLVLVECVLALTQVRSVAAQLREAGIGVTVEVGSWNAPQPGTPAATLGGEGVTLWFARKPLAEGALALAKILRTPEAATACRQHGVVPMLNA